MESMVRSPTTSAGRSETFAAMRQTGSQGVLSGPVIGGKLAKTKGIALSVEKLLSALRKGLTHSYPADERILIPPSGRSPLWCRPQGS